MTDGGDQHFFKLKKWMGNYYELGASARAVGPLQVRRSYNIMEFAHEQEFFSV